MTLLQISLTTIIRNDGTEPDKLDEDKWRKTKTVTKGYIPYTYIRSLLNNEYIRLVKEVDTFKELIKF